MTQPLGIAIIGCGYVADSYRYSLRYHDETIRLMGVFDRDAARLSAFTSCWGDTPYRSLQHALDDRSVQIIVNLTDPESHADVTGAAIAAGKHVYSEKPLALTAKEARALGDAADAAGIRLSSAPCNVLGESAQTAIRAVRSGQIGKVRLVYAELDDGMVHRADYRNWISRSGRPWPARGEFATGCTFEHAGYALTILGALLGPIRRVTAFSSLLISDKLVDPPLANSAPDFSVGLLEFDEGVVCRLTNSIVAPYDHRMRVIGDDGYLEIKELWDYASPVVLRRAAGGRLSRLIERRLPSISGRRLKLARPPLFRGGRGRPTMDFMRGVAELAASIAGGRKSRLSSDFAIHITEVTEMLQFPERFAVPAVVTSSFSPIDPMDWAQ